MTSSSLMLGLTLSYRPFLDPINAYDAWYLLLLPLALGISLAYKAVRVKSMADFPRHVIVMTMQIIIAMISLGVASFVLIEYLLPALLPMKM